MNFNSIISSINILAGIWSIVLGISGLSFATTFVVDLGSGTLWCQILFGLVFLCGAAGSWETYRFRKKLFLFQSERLRESLRGEDPHGLG
jgi:hypothetical protein